jgi:hypothetical protein
MSDALECARAEELLSDHLEGALDPPLRDRLERHLASCGPCAELRAALGEVVSALRAAPELEPAGDLAERAAAAALRAAEARRFSARRLLPRRLGASVREMFAVPGLPLARGVAAALAVATTAAVLLAQSFVGEPVRAANRVVERTVDVSAYLAERKDRLIEDFRLLRVVIGTAFEGRLDRVNDRVDDYRRLLERRRSVPARPEAEPDAKAPAVQDGGAPAGAERRDASRSAAPFPKFMNLRFAAAVERCMTCEATGRIGRPLTRSRARRLA